MREELNTGSTSTIATLLSTSEASIPVDRRDARQHRKISVVFCSRDLRRLWRPKNPHDLLPGRGSGPWDRTRFNPTEPPSNRLNLAGRVARRPLDGSQLSRKFRLARRSSDWQAP